MCSSTETNEGGKTMHLEAAYFCALFSLNLWFHTFVLIKATKLESVTYMITKGQGSEGNDGRESTRPQMLPKVKRKLHSGSPQWEQRMELKNRAPSLQCLATVLKDIPDYLVCDKLLWNNSISLFLGFFSVKSHYKKLNRL